MRVAHLAAQAMHFLGQSLHLAFGTQSRAAVRVPGAGVERAAKRLAAKRDANLAIPDAEQWTRQRARAAERANFKAYRSSKKKLESSMKAAALREFQAKKREAAK